MPETTKSLGKILTSPAGFACNNRGCYLSEISTNNRKTKGVAFLPSLLSFLAFMILSSVFRGSLLRTNKKDFGAHISPAKETKAILFTDKLSAMIQRSANFSIQSPSQATAKLLTFFGR